MKVFISSIISGMEPFRAAAREAIEQLGHTAVLAGDFGAQPRSPQIACLDGLRQSALTILIIGERNCAKQYSGISATHEEFREARDRRPILAFFQEGVSHDTEQAAFVKEAGAWEKGLFREGFTTAEQLKAQITRRVHQWEVANAAGPIDDGDMLDRALKLLPKVDDRNNRGNNFVTLAIAAGPRQALLRPAQLENGSFKKEIQKAALFGASPIFGPEEKTIVSIRDDALELSQGDNRGTFTLDGEGCLIFKLPVNSDSHFGGMIVIEEDVADALKNALSFAVEIWDTIDATQRISHAAFACSLLSGNYGVWRTRAEQAASPDRYSIDSSNGERKPIHLNPATRVRSAVSYQRDEIVDDFITLLRRQSKGARFR
jgi:hypothetical protein